MTSSETEVDSETADESSDSEVELPVCNDAEAMEACLALLMAYRAAVREGALTGADTCAADTWNTDSRRRRACEEEVAVLHGLLYCESLARWTTHLHAMQEALV